MERYTKTEWIPRTTMVSSTNLNKIENQLEAVTDEVIDAQSKITNPTGEVATYNTVKAVNDMHVGQRGVGMGPNTNNLYVEGSTYMMPKDQAYTVTGPGAPGGNIFLQPGKAICSFTKAGPKQNDDGTQDSGIRTIGFVGQVFQEDKDNNEDSVYIGTNVSRLYLYSRTAYPTIVSNKTIFTKNYGVSTLDSDGEVEHLNEEVQTVSPMATQEWVLEMMDNLGMVGGGAEDTSSYTECPVNLTTAFDVTGSMEFLDEWLRSHNWSLGTNGEITLIGGNSTSYIPLFQKDVFNDMYVDLSSLDNNGKTIGNLHFVLYKNTDYAYVIRFEKNRYSLSMFGKWGGKQNEYNYAINFDPTNLLNGSEILRVKHDEENQLHVFSTINSSGEEKSILSLSKFAFSGMHMFTSQSTVENIGFGVKVADAATCLPKIVKRPSNFTPSVKTSSFAVVRQREKQQLVEEIESVKDMITTYPLMARNKDSFEDYINELVEAKVNEILNKNKDGE